MPRFRRDFLQQLLAVGAIQSLAAPSGIGRAMDGLLDQDTVKDLNPDVDEKAFLFWSDLLSSDAKPVLGANGQTRGGGSTGSEDVQPVFLHYGPEGFKNAAELDITKLSPGAT